MERDNVAAIEWLINNEQKKLTAWEMDFLESIQSRNGMLTPKQQAILDDMWEEIMQKRSR